MQTASARCAPPPQGAEWIATRNGFHAFEDLPSQLAASPLSKAPSSLEEPMNTMLTAAIRPRR